MLKALAKTGTRRLRTAREVTTGCVFCDASWNFLFSSRELSIPSQRVRDDGVHVLFIDFVICSRLFEE